MNGDPAFAAAIVARADEISAVGKWIGILEFMAFAVMHKQRVILHLVEGATDIVAELAPALIDRSWKVAPFPGRIVACRLAGAV